MVRLYSLLSLYDRHRPITILLAVGLAVRLLGLGDELWYDEAFSLALARLPLPNLVGAVLGDVHPPLWYLLEWAIWHLGGQGDVWLRLPSLVLGLANVMGVYLLARRIIPGGAVGALALACVSPFLVYYSQEARMYQLMLSGLLLALAGGMRGRFAWFVGGSLLALYSHNLAGISLAVVVVAVVVWHGRAVLWPLFFYGVVVGLAWLPGAVLLIAQMAHIARGFWIMPITLGTWLVGLTTIVWYSLPPWLQYHGFVLGLVVILVTTVLAVRGLWTSRGRSRRGLALGLILFYGPPVGLALASWVWRSVFLARGLILSGVGLALLVGYTWQCLGQRERRIALCLVIPFLALNYGGQYGPGQGRDRDDLRGLAYTINERARPGDVVYHLALTSYITMGPYLEGVPVYVLPQAGDLAQSLSNPTKEAMLIPQARACDLEWLRLWVVDFRTPYTSQAEVKAGDDLRARYTILETIPVYQDSLVSAEVVLLQRPGGDLREPTSPPQVTSPGQDRKP